MVIVQRMFVCTGTVVATFLRDLLWTSGYSWLLC